ncbi:MAG: hypothetical protein GY896_22760 [Gammaproteobacteria bacterium]|nr:hypothetical protein [Gammaproteobacteria bacterium]
MAIKEIKFKFNGTRPLMIQSERTANPLDPITKGIKKYTSKPASQKTDADHLAVMRLEFEAAFYVGAPDNLGPCIPGLNVEACIRDGAKSQRKGATITRALNVAEEWIAVQYKGPRTIAELWAQPDKFVDYRGVKPTSKAKVMRCRPVFHGWSLVATVEFEDEMINRKQLIEYVKYAGKYVSVGTYRPTFGRFSVSVLKK